MSTVRHNTAVANLITEMATKWLKGGNPQDLDILDKGKIHVQVERNRMEHFFLLLRTTHNLKLVSCLCLEFSI